MTSGSDCVPVLFDTDIGSDIDDAVCLAYLLKQPRCELVGITTVSGMAQRRAMLASAVCHAAGRHDVPIFSGSEIPLVGEQRQPAAAQCEILPNWPHVEEFAPNAAIDFMRGVIHERPGEITLLAVGPFTNVALLFRLDPAVPKLLRSLVIMGGAYYFAPGHQQRSTWGTYVELNARNDPSATAAIFSTEDVPILALGYNVTSRCVLAGRTARSKLKGGPLDVVHDAAEVWYRERDSITFHDPLAAATIFRPEICEYEDGTVNVELQSDRLLGMTAWDSRTEHKRHRVAVDVNVDAFFEEYFSITTGEGV